jgi:hypothetical protein
MHIVVIAWIYVVLMMSITEHSVVAGIMTFLLYGVLPLSIILYLTGTGKRKRARQAAEKMRRSSVEHAAEPAEPRPASRVTPPASGDKGESDST